MTNPSHYYQPRPAAYAAPDEDRLTFVETYGELIAAALGLVTFGFALGLMAACLVVL